MSPLEELKSKITSYCDAAKESGCKIINGSFGVYTEGNYWKLNDDFRACPIGFVLNEQKLVSYSHYATAAKVLDTTEQMVGYFVLGFEHGKFSREEFEELQHEHREIFIFGKKIRAIYGSG